jgi:hypothetical protein
MVENWTYRRLMAQSWMRLADEVARAEMAIVLNGTQQRH